MSLEKYFEEYKGSFILIPRAVFEKEIKNYNSTVYRTIESNRLNGDKI